MLHHIALGARDVAKLADFYRDLFELPELRRFDDETGLRSIWLSLGPQFVLMIERTTRSRDDVAGLEVGAGPFLLAFSATVPDPASRPVLEEKLAHWGAVVEGHTAHTRYFRDPEGNRVAVSSYVFPEAPWMMEGSSAMSTEEQR